MLCFCWRHTHSTDYTPINEIREGVYWFHHGCLSICLSVRLWKMWFPHDNSISFWATVNDTSHVYCPWPEEYPYWIWGEKVKCQGQIYTLKFAQFPHDNYITFWHAIMILHTGVDHEPRRTSIEFGVKGQGQIWTLDFAKFLHNNYYLLTYSDDTWLMCCLWSKEQPYWFWSQRSRSNLFKGQGQTWKVWICCRAGYLSLLWQVSFSLIYVQLN